MKTILSTLAIALFVGASAGGAAVAQTASTGAMASDSHMTAPAKKPVKKAKPAAKSAGAMSSGAMPSGSMSTGSMSSGAMSSGAMSSDKMATDHMASDKAKH